MTPRAASAKVLFALLVSSVVIVITPKRLIADPTSPIVAPSPKEWADLINGVVPAKPPIPLIYGIGVGSIGVRHTRSLFKDTIHMSLTATVNGKTVQTVIWDPALNCANCHDGRDFKEGKYLFKNFGVALNGLNRLYPTDRIGIAVSVVNAGHVAGIDEKLLSLAGVLVDYFCDSVAVCELFGPVSDFVKNVIDPDCDGPLVLTSFTMTGFDVMYLAADPNHPGLISIPGTADNTFYGADNPGDHCGPNSNYILNLYPFRS